MSRFYSIGSYMLALIWAATLSYADTDCQAQAFPLWPKGKEPASADGKSDTGKNNGSKGDDSNVTKSAPSAGSAVKISPASNAAPSIQQSADGAKSGRAKSNDLKNGTVQILVPVDFSPGPGALGSGSTATDPMAIYRDAGINLEKERKIRQLAGEFEGMQRVRLKLLSNLLDDMKQFELQTDPDPKAVMEKQNEINKLSATMANDRVKLLLEIRDVMSHDEKERLVESLQRGPSGVKPQN